MRDPLYLQDKRFWSGVWTVALPIALQNLISTSLNITDNVMVGQLGEKAIGGLALANQISFLVILFTFGISSGGSVFSAQYWGAKDIAGIRRTQGLAAILALGASTIFAVLGTVMPDRLIAIYSNDPEVIYLGASYLTISSWSFPLLALSMTIGVILRSTGRVRIPLVMSLVAVAINIFLNYVLIFGHLGFPAMGVVGSAIGTLIARIVELLGLILASYAVKAPNAGSLKELLHFPKHFAKPYLKTTLPVLGQEMGWSLGTTTMMAIYSHLGTASLAAASITDTLNQFFSIFIFGSVNATAIIVGNTVGEGRINRVKLLSRRFAAFSSLQGIVVGVVIAVSSGFLLSLFKIGDEARTLAQAQLLVLAAIMPIRSYLYHLTVGLFRGAGDTKTALFIEVGGLWLLAIPLALFAANVLHLPLAGVFAMVGIQEIIITVFATLWLRTGKWIQPLAGRAAKP